MTPSFKSIHTWGARKSTGAEEENGRAAAKRDPRSVTNIFSPFLLCLSLLYLNISLHSSSWFQFLIAAGCLTGCLGLNGCLAGCPSSKVTSARAREGFPDEKWQWRLQCSAVLRVLHVSSVRHQCGAPQCRALRSGRLGDPALPAETQCLGILNPCTDTNLPHLFACL